MRSIRNIVPLVQYTRLGTLLDATDLDEESVALVLCLRDWYERLDDAGSELGMNASAVTRLYHRCVWAHPNRFTIGKYPWNMPRYFTNGELLLIRGIGSEALTVIRKAEEYPREPMSCLTDAEFKYLHRNFPGLNFEAIAVEVKMMST